MARYQAQSENSAWASDTALVATKPSWSSATDNFVTARTVSSVISRSVTGDSLIATWQ